ncbi:MAG: HAD-IIA family hydrolase [Candidatus Hadarchaeota archaeon]
MSKAFEGALGVVLDMDGVLYRGDEPIAGSAEAVKCLRDEGRGVVFSTNNSAKSRAAYVKKLGRMGIEADKSEIITSGYATAAYLREYSRAAKVYPIGESGLVQELKLAGIKVLSSSKARSATHVVVGIDKNLSYGKIAAGFQALSAGAQFIATNPDPTYPTEAGLSPGAGATIGALAGCFGKGPSLVVGKPSAMMIRMALEILGTGRKTAVVGDRIDMDVAVGKKLGLRTVLLLSGVCTPGEARKVRGTRMTPDFVAKNLAEAVGCQR